MRIGDRAPQIKLNCTNGTVFASSDALKRGPLVVAFYPLAFTSG